MESVRILEIGAWTYCKDEYPASTTLLWTGERPYPDPAAPGVYSCTPLRFLRAMRDVRAGKYDIVIAYMHIWPAWHPRYWLRSLMREPSRPFAAVARVFGVTWLRLFKSSVPLAVLDMTDPFTIGRHSVFLLDHADAVFKRELPADRWHILSGMRGTIASRRIRRRARWVERLAKLRPIALPALRLDRIQRTSDGFPEKTTDVFFSGEVMENSWPRRAGRAEIEALRRNGFRVDVPETRLSHAAFLQRMSSAWLAWSPSGFSWECYRTAEAAQCLTVPVVNYPTVERHAPLREGEHALFYDVVPGDLTRTITHALRDKDRLRQMAVAARDHVVAHHLRGAVIDYVVAETRRSAALTKPTL